jgi:hypothetical protein
MPPLEKAEDSLRRAYTDRLFTALGREICINLSNWAGLANICEQSAINKLTIPQKLDAHWKYISSGEKIT